MTAVDIAVSQLKTDEGYRQHVYNDALGNPTIGFGCCLASGISYSAALALLTAQTAETETALNNYYWFTQLDDVRKATVINWCFNVGVPGMLHFVKTLNAIAVGNWAEAHDELLDSLAAKQNPNRYQRLAQQLLTGTI